MRIIGLAGWSGAGKTTLLTQVIPVLRKRGLEVSTIKHAHHSFDLDKPGKDSHSHRAAGARQVLISSAQRWALMNELRGAPEPSLPELIAQLSPVDLVIVEGFKHGAHPKLEVYRAALGKSPLYLDDTFVVAVATDSAVPDAKIPVVALSDYEGIATLLTQCAVAPGALGDQTLSSS
jgi:molybdopterin-guanine dinucleotide biosynthesis adapter protein